MSHADVLVIGLGAAGAAALYQLSQRGLNVVGIDRFSPPHAMGSSHGETRITRCGIGEGDVYVPLAQRSHLIWREMEASTGETLMLTCGMLIIGPADGQAVVHGRPDFVARSIAAAKAFGIDHEVLSSSEIMHRTPQFELRSDERGYYEPGGGVLYPERCIAVQLQLAEQRGATIMRNEEVLRIDHRNCSVQIQTNRATYEADQVVLAAGAWTWDLIDAPAAAIALQPQQLNWFACEDPAQYHSERLPAFIWSYGPGPEDGFYGFPISSGAPTKALKVAMESTRSIATMSDFDRAPRPADAREMYRRHLRGRLKGVRPVAVKQAACLYTTTSDSDFIIGRPDGHDRVLVASACSGHGFKHSPAVGELIAESIISGGKLEPPPAFALRRFVGGAS